MVARSIQHAAALWLAWMSGALGCANESRQLAAGDGGGASDAVDAGGLDLDSPRDTSAGDALLDIDVGDDAVDVGDARHDSGREPDCSLGVEVLWASPPVVGELVLAEVRPIEGCDLVGDVGDTYLRSCGAFRSGSADIGSDLLAYQQPGVAGRSRTAWVLPVHEGSWTCVVTATIYLPGESPREIETVTGNIEVTVRPTRGGEVRCNIGREVDRWMNEIIDPYSDDAADVCACRVFVDDIAQDSGQYRWWATNGRADAHGDFELRDLSGGISSWFYVDAQPDPYLDLFVPPYRTIETEIVATPLDPDAPSVRPAYLLMSGQDG